MHRIAFVAIAFVSLTVKAQEVDPWSYVRAEGIRSHVEFLAQDLLEGRATGSRGYDIAAAYVASQFRQYGLLPAGENETFFQSVPLLEATAVLPGSSAELQRDGSTRSFEYGTDYLPSADFTATKSTLTAPLAFAGFGIDAPELGYTDFDDVDVKGRIAVILSGAPEKFSPGERGYYSWDLVKLTALIARGAVGVIMVDSPEDARLTPWERRVAMSWVPLMSWLDPEGQPADVLPEIKLRFRFNQNAAQALFENAEQSLSEVFAAAKEGRGQGFDLPGTLTLSATTGMRRSSSANVIAMLPGSDPKLRNEYVVVTAHLDHLGRGVAVNGDSIYNGAYDNATGMGILLEMARAMRADGVRPRRSVIFAAVTAAESGHLGSAYFAQYPTVNKQKLVANINIDSPLVLTRTADVVAVGAAHSSLGAIADQAASAQGYKVTKSKLPDGARLTGSDQFSFIRQGIPALLLQSGSQARDRKVDALALQEDYRRNRYRQPSDDLTQTIDYTAAADLARINMRIILEVANNNERPRWKSQDFLRKKFPPPAPEKKPNEMPRLRRSE